MNKKIKKVFWDNIAQYGFMLENSFETVVMLDIIDATCQTVTFCDKYFGKFETESEYKEIFNTIYDNVDDRDKEIFSRASFDNLEKFATIKNNQKLIIPFRLKADEEVWFELTAVREFLHDNILLILIREISDSVMQEKSQRTLNELMNNLAQDIQTPLYSVIGLTELCSRHVDNPIKIKAYVERLRMVTEHMMNLVKDISQIGNNQNGNNSIHVEEFNISEFVKDIVIIMQQRFMKRGVNFNVSFKGLRHENLIGDDMKIGRIILNIMGNIAKYASFGNEVLLLIQEKETEKSNKKEIDFYISANRESLFNQGTPTDEELDNKWTKENESEPEMIMIRDQVHNLGGKFFYNIEPGIGSMFYVKLFLQVGYKEEQKIENKKYIGEKALIADDNEHTLSWMKEILEEQGIEVVLAKGSREVINIAYESVKHSEKFDFVILSWKMQSMDGIETTAILRKILGFRIPIIMQSAYELSDVEFMARDKGVNFFCLKPVTMQDLDPILSIMNHHVEKFEQEEHIPDFQGKNILLVESDANYREIIEECLEDVSISYEVAKNGKQAVETMMIAEENEFDLILMETDMEQLNGYDATRMIRKLQGDYVKQIPILALSNKNGKKETMRIAQCGMNGQIKKPLELRDLYETLHGFLNK